MPDSLEQKKMAEEFARKHHDFFLPYGKADEIIALVMTKGRGAREELMRMLLKYAIDSHANVKKVQASMIDIAKSKD